MLATPNRTTTGQEVCPDYQHKIISPTIPFDLAPVIDQNLKCGLHMVVGERLFICEKYAGKGFFLASKINLVKVRGTTMIGYGDEWYGVYLSGQ